MKKLSYMKNWENFNESKSYELTDEQKDFLWRKLEYTKRRKASETENELYQLLKGDKKSLTVEEYKKVLNSLEYSFKKKFRDGEVKRGIGAELQGNLPEDWMGVNFSSLQAREKKLEREEEKKKNKK